MGRALAALVAADAPALERLKISNNSLGDADLAHLVDALPLNRHLRTLDMEFCAMSALFAHHRLLPAVRANESLRKLVCTSRHAIAAGAAHSEAEELVMRRALS